MSACPVVLKTCFWRDVSRPLVIPTRAPRRLGSAVIPVLAAVVRGALMVALAARGHMPAERLCSAGFNCRHHFELGQADISLIGLPPRRAVLVE